MRVLIGLTSTAGAVPATCSMGLDLESVPLAAAVRRSNERSIERLVELYTDPPTAGRSVGVSIERVFEL
jgi:hypothetical protein